MKSVPRRAPGAATEVLATFSETGGCACSLLTDDADWDAPVWSMRAEVLDPLARTLEALGAAAPEGFTLTALWSGDDIGEHRIVSLGELTALARAGRLGTRTRYEVRPEPA